MIDALATQPHYLDHLAPIWRALPDDQRGDLVLPDHLRDHAEGLGLDHLDTDRMRPSRERVLVVGAADLVTLSRRPRHQLVLVEHGAGQTYQGVEHVGYPGGPHRDAVGLFLCPSPRVARLNLERYPDAQAAVVGCPKLDQWLPRPETAGELVVVLSFHWACSVTLEAGTAWGDWLPYLEDLGNNFEDRGWELALHAHPRNRDVAPWARKLGLRFLEHFDQVVGEAAAYCCDNSSTLYEAAAVGMPVVGLDSPAWRRDVNHGLRFWDLIPGPTAVEPDELLYALEGWLHEWPPAQWVADRRAVVDQVYAFTDGTSTARAVEAILDWADS